MKGCLHWVVGKINCGETVHQAYELRGVEVTLTGTIEARNGVVHGWPKPTPAVELVALAPGGKIQWDPAARGPQAAEPAEAGAFDTLTNLPETAGAADLSPLLVRCFKPSRVPASSTPG